MKGVVAVQLQRLEKLLTQRGIALAVDDSARRWLAETGYDPVYGARPLKRVIQNTLQNPIAQMILEGKAREGQKIAVSARNGALVLAAT
jgi:ATP-dependent Clp protease ATP-binding subunit ClpB